MVGERDSWAAYQLDAATLALGRWLENRLAERDERGQPRHTAGALLGELRARRAAIEKARRGEPDQAAPPAPSGEFGRLLSNPAPWRKVRKARIGPDGTW